MIPEIIKDDDHQKSTSYFAKSTPERKVSNLRDTSVNFDRVGRKSDPIMWSDDTRSASLIDKQ